MIKQAEIRTCIGTHARLFNMLFLFNKNRTNFRYVSGPLFKKAFISSTTKQTYTLISYAIRYSCFSPLFWTQPSFTTFWSFMLALRSEFKGQGWKSPELYFPLVVLSSSPARLTLFSSPLTFSATLWCNVSASLHFHSLGTFQTLQWWVSLKENNKHTHTWIIPFRFSPSATQTLPWEIKSLFGVGKHFPPLPVALLFLPHTGCCMWQHGLETTKPFRWASSKESEAFHLWNWAQNRVIK